MHLKDFKNFSYISSLILLVEGLSFLLCIPYAIYFHEPLKPFYLSSLVTLSIGSLLYMISNKKIKPVINTKESIVLVVSSWIILILAGTLPYFVSQTVPSFVDAVFEATSGLTTTGSSVLANIEGLPKSILFWRSLTHWLGGMATIIFVITALPFLNIGGYKLFSIGSSLQEKQSPDFSYILKRIAVAYFGLTAAQVLLLYFGGMNLFESFCHSFGTVSTGSFSPKNGSIEGYSSYIQYVMALFMLLAGIGYVFYFFLVTGKLRTATRNEEIRWYGSIILSVTTIITAILYFKTGSGFETAFRQGFFQVISFVTSSGYSTTNYLLWPGSAFLLLFFFLLIGSCSGSASGGIKIPRFLIFLKNLKATFRTLTSNDDDEFRIRYKEGLN